MLATTKPVKDQTGLAGIELLLILFALLAVAGIGLYLRDQQAKPAARVVSSQTTGDTGVSTSPGGVPGGATGATSNQTNTGATSKLKAIKIESAGLQISVPSSLSDLTYHVTKQPNGSFWVGFSTASLTRAAPSCAASSGNGAFDLVIHANGKYQPPSNVSSGGLIKQYASDYLAYMLPTAPCAKGLSTATQRLYDDQAQDFYLSLGSVKAL